MRVRTRALGVALALVFLASACSTGTTDGDGVDRGSMGGGALPAAMPAVTLEGFDGAPDVDLSTLERPTLVNLWSTSCAPCRDEMPVLEEFSQKYAGQVDVLGVNYQDVVYGGARKLVAETGVTYPLVRDVDGDLDRAAPFPHVGFLPFMAFVDADGQMVGREFVVVDDLTELEELVGKYLDLPATDGEDAA